MTSRRQFLATLAAAAATPALAQSSVDRTRIKITCMPESVAAGMKPRPVTRPAFEGAVAVLLNDQRPRFLPVTAADLQALGLTEDQAFELGRANVAPEIRSLVEMYAGYTPNTTIANVQGSPFEASRMLDPASFRPIAERVGGGLYVSCPRGEQVMYMSTRHADKVDAFRRYTRNGYEQGKPPYFSQVFTWSPGGWQVLV